MVPRIRACLSETHSTHLELVRHFLSQQLVSDLTSSDQVRRLVITVLSALACVGPLIVRLYIPKYAYIESRDTGDLYLAEVHADRLFFISLSMITAAIVSVVQWQGLFPNRRDYLVLKPLPIRLYQIFVARFLSSLIIAVVVIVNLNLATSVLFPLLTSGRWQFPSFGTHYVVAHAAATFGAGLFAFFAVGAMYGAVMNLLPPRAFDRVSVFMQALLATAFVASVPYVLDMPNWYERIAARPHWMSLFPPAWFLGLYETLLGTRDRYFRQLAGMAVMGIGSALFLALATYFLSYRRYARLVLEPAMPRPNRRSLIDKTAAALLGVFMGCSKTQAAFVFAIHTLRRS